MKILHYLGSIWDGGVASIVYSLAKYTVSQGHQVDLLSMYTPPKSTDYKAKYDNIGVRTYFSDTNNRYSIKHISQLRNLMKDYDIIHIHQFPEQMHGALASLLGNIKIKPKIITTEHSTWNNRRNHKLLQYLDRGMYSSYDKIVCISSHTEIALKSWLGSDKINTKITTITNGIDISRYETAKNEIDNYIPYSPNDFYIGMAARMNHPKDPFTLIKALKFLPENVKIIFMGDGTLLPQAKQLTQNLNLSDRIYFLGNVPDISPIIKGCNIGVLSTLWDGFGLSAAEYMAAGIPAVVSEVDGLKDVVGDPALWCKPQDEKSLAYIIKKLIEDKSLYDLKVSSAKERVKKFSHEEMGKQYVTLYETLLGNK